MKGIVVTRLLDKNGPKQFLLNDEDKPRVFESKDAAIGLLLSEGYSKESIDQYSFEDAEKVYEEYGDEKCVTTVHDLGF